MNSLFGIPLTSILVALTLALGVIFAILGVIGWRQPLFVRMGLRNIVRRKAQTALIVIGLMLSTLIVSAAFATGDTVGYSITNATYDSFEEIDFVLAFDEEIVVAGDERYLTDEFLAALHAEFDGDPDIDGISGTLAETLPVLNPARRLAEAEASLIGVDPATADPFRGLKTPGGEELSAASLGGRSAYLTENLAEEIGAGAGDRVDVYFDREPTAFEVIGVVQDTSITGTGAGGGGIVVNLGTARELTGREGKLSAIAVSIEGGVRDTLDRSDAVEERLEAFLDANPEGRATVALTKSAAVAVGELVGSIFVTFFLIFGLFAIAAGVLLIFLIFVMLAAERRSEMGMARAVGMQRLHLTETYLAEGMAYNLGSAAVGALLGLGVAFLLVRVLAEIVGDAFGSSIAFRLNWQSFLISYALGVVITFATVAFSSFRVANLNIVRAIRDLPEPQPLRGRDRSPRGLATATVATLWLVGWIAVLTLGAVYVLAVVSALTAVLFGDLPPILSGVSGGAALLASGVLMVFGARTVRRGRFLDLEGGRAWLLWWAWLAVFSVAALLTWALLLSRDWAAARRNAGGWAVVMLAAGLLLIWMSGWGLDAPFFSWWRSRAFAYTGGVTLGVLALAMLAVYFGGAPRPTFSLAGLALVWYWLLPLPFSLVAETGDATQIDPIDAIARLTGLPRPLEQDGNIEMFFVSGIAMTASAVLVVVFGSESMLGLVRRVGRLLGGAAPAVQTAVAYPLAAKFRTGMTLAMFGLVVFSVVVMASLNSNFTQAFLGDDAAGGFDVSVEVNPANRIPDLRAALREAGEDPDADLAGVGRYVSAFPLVRPGGEDGGEDGGYRLAGVDDEFIALQQLPFEHRAIGYDSDEAVWEAIRTDPAVAVIDSSRLAAADGGFGGDDDEFELGVGDAELRAEPWRPIPLTLVDPSTGEETVLRVIGVLEPATLGVIEEFSAIVTRLETVEARFGGGEIEHYYAVTRDPTDEASRQAARDIESALIEYGVQAASIDRLIDDQASTSRSFQLLFEAFMGLGLVVGVAALGVIAFRTVVERRQQIGMLRAIGYSRRLITLSYFLESSFIALAGIAIGVVLGIALSYNLLTSDAFTAGTDIDFSVPWARLAVVVGIAYVASALMTLLPARAASRVAVAEALRYE